MSEFKREERYVVLKKKHLRLLTDDANEELENIIEAIKLARQLSFDDAAPELKCVVVESDWPIYDHVWDMVQRMSEGKPQLVDQLKARIADLEQVLTNVKNCPESDLTQYCISVDSMVCEALAKTEQQSLASIQADHANQLAIEVFNQFNKWGKAQIWLNKKAEQLRNSKDGNHE